MSPTSPRNPQCPDRRASHPWISFLDTEPNQAEPGQTGPDHPHPTNHTTHNPPASRRPHFLPAAKPKCMRLDAQSACSTSEAEDYGGDPPIRNTMPFFTLRIRTGTCPHHTRKQEHLATAATQTLTWGGFCIRTRAQRQEGQDSRRLPPGTPDAMSCPLRLCVHAITDERSIMSMIDDIPMFCNHRSMFLSAGGRRADDG
jgi:hypothetical protein